ncbi:MAG: LacI family DNA-binding transcriptional regulator [Shewanella sp.]
MITIREVAELACVSQATVSRVVNDHKRVTESTRVRVLAAMKTLGYQPNAFAQALASNRSCSIGMVVGNLGGFFYGPLMHSVEEQARESGHHLIVTSGEDNHAKEWDAINFLLSRRVDALILHVSAITDYELIDLAARGIKIVIINRYVPELAQQCVYLDNEYGGYLATKHLLDLGHTRIACITGQLNKGDSRDRLQGYRNALQEHGLLFDSALVAEGSFDEDGGLNTARRLVQRQLNFTAVVCGNDNIAMSVYDVLVEHGLSAGIHVSVVGYDDAIVARYLRPKLTTVRFPIIEMGKTAVKLVLQKHSVKTTEVCLKMTPELIIRASTSKFTTTDTDC